MKIGIVGHEALKFTPEREAAARQVIRDLLADHDVDLVVSGHCHLGGIDIWAIQEAQAAGVPTMEYPPRKLTWEGGYKQRNLQIAQASDLLVCIVVQHLPHGYHGMRFPMCYHCKTNSHIKSGGCWTLQQAARLGKLTHLEVV